MVQRVQRLGMLGGTFNPPHLAHLIGGEIAVETFGLDRLLFVPANIPPHKTRTTNIAEARHRLAMTTLAVFGNSKFAASDIEIKRAGTSYTIDTIRELKALHVVEQFFLVIGLDNLAIFDSWFKSEEIFEEATVVVMMRPSHEFSAIPDTLRSKVKPLLMPLLEISSTDIRERIAGGRSSRYLVPDSVGAYIEEHQLYRHVSR